jgi:hypothetical protein
MIKALGDLAASSIIVVVAVGTIAGTMQGKAFDGAKAWQFVFNGYNRLVHGVDVSAGRAKPTNETPKQLIDNNIQSLATLLPPPSPVPVPRQESQQPITTTSGQINLSQCLPGTANQSNNLSGNQVEVLKKGPFKTLWEVQGKVGNPLCAISPTTWLYRSGNTLITVAEVKGSVVVR